MLKIRRGEDVLAWTTDYVIETLAGGGKLFVVPVLCLAQLPAVEHCTGKHLLEVFARIELSEGEDWVPASFLIGDFMLLKTGVPELQVAGFLHLPEDAEQPRLGYAISTVMRVWKEVYGGA